MIKNESAILQRCLEAVENVVDCFCILDTGSTDNSVEIAQDFLKTRVGCVTVEPWQNFGHNRTISFQNAQKYIRDELKWDPNETYGLLLDADMMFVPGTLKQQNLTRPGYRLIQVNGSLEYYNARLIRMDIPWRCVGVTHEYWDGPQADALPKSICYIDDRNDGGCKHDKYERDQRLLEKGLEEDPKNVRYMFYLAQTYKCMGKFKESIAMYKKRIAAGGWVEEVWYSHYMIGECWKALGNIGKFEYWMQLAHNYRPHRVESIYKLAEHYRIHGQHYKAYHYVKLGRSVPYPTNDVLFIEGDVYRGKFEYEASILDYYVHQDKSIGLRDSISYLLKRSEFSNNVISNIKFYTKPIGEKFEKLTIPEVFGRDYRPSAISIVDYPYANVRFVNYLPPVDGSYKSRTGGPIETRNAYINIETMECVSAMDEPSYPFDSHVRGLEDLRLYKKLDKLYFTATSFKQFIENKISIVHGEYDYKNKQFLNCMGIHSPTNSNCEKNWVNIPNTDNFIYSWRPLRVGKIVNNSFIYFIEHNTPPFFEHLRGSSPPFKVGDKWWALVHFVEYSTPRKYYHCFVELDEKYYPLRLTLPFYFRDNGIEYSISCIPSDGDTFHFYTSFTDTDPHRVIVNKNKLSWINI